MRGAKRLGRVPAFAFSELNKIKDEVRARGIDIIDLTEGDPDIPTPAEVVEELRVQVLNPVHHRYPAYLGSAEFRAACAQWLEARHGVEVDPGSEVMATIGAKDGIAKATWALLDPGDIALVPDPAYPVYRNQALLAGACVYDLPLLAQNAYLPDLDSIPVNVARKAALLYLNYPNNPTAAIVDRSFFDEVCAFAAEYDVIVLHDASYAEIVYDGYRAPSILELEGARDRVIELHSLSKSFNMTGWRLGFCAGSSEILQALALVKTNTDSGQFGAIQAAGAAALTGEARDHPDRMCRVYSARRELMSRFLRECGFSAEPPRATFYFWLPTPAGETASSFTSRVLEATGVALTPGDAFGPSGARHFRISLTAPDQALEEAGRRLVAYLGANGGSM